MTKPPESTHDSLNRELARMRVRSIGFWGGWALLIGIVGLYAALTLAPERVDYLQAEVTGVSQLVTEHGPIQQIGVLVEGETRVAGTPARLVHPQTGDIACLRRTVTGGPLGRTTYAVAPETMCQSRSATPGVD